MKRSEINNYISDAVAFFENYKFKLPPWAFFKPEEWRTKGIEYSEVIDNSLGWDITDFGSGDFKKTGLFLFTIRNGNIKSDNYKKPYAEKIMIVDVNQVTPLHFHWSKMEDIINRGGGKLCMQLWKSNESKKLTEEKFSVQIDGVTNWFNPGGFLKLKPGESICLEPYLYHKFWAEEEKTLVGEVSMVNDDANDNCFYESIGRFPDIIENESPIHLLCNEYKKYI
jgi:D-lyxose ketol-isomerase